MPKKPKPERWCVVVMSREGGYTFVKKVYTGFKTNHEAGNFVERNPRLRKVHAYYAKEVSK